jgi:hypothetical protein
MNALKDTNTSVLRRARSLLPLLVAALPAALVACGGPEGTARTAASSDGAGSDPASSESPKLRGDLASATVYDATGNPLACEPPTSGCKPADDLAFRDQCKLAGFQVRQCGCSFVCSGNIAAASAAKKYFDASGTPQTCEKPDSSCTPPPASAAFQDACTDKGHRLEICGCSWLCSGKPTP